MKKLLSILWHFYYVIGCILISPVYFFGWLFEDRETTREAERQMDEKLMENSRSYKRDKKLNDLFKI